MPENASDDKPIKLSCHYSFLTTKRWKHSGSLELNLSPTEFHNLKMNSVLCETIVPIIKERHKNRRDIAFVLKGSVFDSRLPITEREAPFTQIIEHYTSRETLTMIYSDKIDHWIAEVNKKHRALIHWFKGDYSPSEHVVEKMLRKEYQKKLPPPSLWHKVLVIPYEKKCAYYFYTKHFPYSRGSWPPFYDRIYKEARVSLAIHASSSGGVTACYVGGVSYYDSEPHRIYDIVSKLLNVLPRKFFRSDLSETLNIINGILCFSANSSLRSKLEFICEALHAAKINKH